MASVKQFGEDVDLDIPCTFPEPNPITGMRVKLIPLHPDHSEQLYEEVGGKANEDLWAYMGHGHFEDITEFRLHIDELAKAKDPQLYTIMDLQSDKLVGYIALMRIDEKNRVIEIGNVLFSKSLQKTTAATEAFYLLACKAFEGGYRRLEWKCDSLNEASRRAGLRFGFTFEGVFRQHMIRNGRNRDSAWHSIIDKEWPSRKKALETWMDPSNYDDDGWQRRDLKSIRKEVEERGIF